MAPTSGHQHTVAGSMDPDWQTHESGGSGEQVPRAAPSSLPCIPRSVLGARCMRASLERPRALAPPNRQVHESALCQSGSMDPGPLCWRPLFGAIRPAKKVGRCILDLKLSVESDYGAPGGPRASPGRVSSSKRNVTNFMTQGSTHETKVRGISREHQNSNNCFN